jgi:hypothetical protein
MSEKNHWSLVYSQGSILLYIAEIPDYTISQIADAMSLTRKKVWGLVGDLRREGMPRIREESRRHFLTYRKGLANWAKAYGSYHSVETLMATVRAAVSSRYVREPIVMGVASLLYFQVSKHSAERAADAFENADRLIRLERHLGIFRELSLQAAALPYEGLVHLFNVIYFYGHFPLIIVVGAWFFWKHPAVYSLIRNSFLASGAIALVVFTLFPVAPPRLIGAGFVDTLQRTRIALTYDKLPGVNEFAAVPSMHVGWNLLLALGLFLSLRHPLARGASLLLPPAMILATVVTGNHYLVDAPLGVMVALSGLVIALLIRHYWPQAALAVSGLRGLDSQTC